jgi:26S proteasome regulatory subunit N7
MGLHLPFFLFPFFFFFYLSSIFFFLVVFICRFVSSGRIYCAIDHVAQIVVTTRAETKNDQFAETIRKGDALLARVQKLSRVISL